MKRGRLPLTALRSFEAAGRHLSFSRAADELFVSQAAISRQIRELEAFIDQPLFQRLHRRVALTDTGQRLLGSLTKSFDDIDRQLSAIVAGPEQSVLRVSVEPSFAGALLIPRLKLFQDIHPEIDVATDSDPRLVEFRNTDIELAIRHSATATSWPRVQARRLMSIALTPVLTPKLLAGGPPLTAPSDLQHYTLLHETNRDSWALWFNAAGLPELAQQRGPIFPDASFALQAAKLGHGIALGDQVMEAEDLAAGSLVRPFDLEVRLGAYWIVARDFKRLSKPAKAFTDWALDEFGIKRSFDMA